MYVLFLLFVLLIAFTLLRQFFVPSTSASWYDDAWTYRKRINIPSHTGSENNVYVTVPSFDATDTSKFQSDCGNLRFTKENGQLLPFYDVDCDATANVHVFFDTLPAGETNYYMYYGNIGAPDGFASADFSTAATNLGSQTAASEEKALGPVAYWKFDEGVDNTCSGGTNDVCDATRNADDGAISNGAAWKSDDLCISGKCLWFDGSNDVVTVTNAAPIDLDGNLSGGFTIEAWIRPNGAGEGSGGRVFYKGTNTWLRVDTLSSGKLDIEGSLDLATTDATLNVSAPITNSGWNHVVLSYTDDGDDEITLWVNGVSVGSSTNGVGSLAADTNDLLIGGDSSNNFQGFIDEFKIYNYERSSSQIQYDFASRGVVKSGGSSAFGAQITSLKFLSDSLVGYWKMDESSWTNDCSTATVLDSSGNGNTGKACPNSTGPTGNTAAKFGNGGTFDGSNDYVDVSDATTLRPGTGSYTLSIWVKRAAGISANEFIFDKNGGNTNGYDMFITSSGIIRCRIGASTTVESTSSIADGNWHFVVCSMNRAGNGQVFLDGVPSGSAVDLKTITDDLNNSAQTLRIGNRPSGNYFTGTLDEARMYLRALSSSEVQQLYTWGPPPVVYYKMDEPSWTNNCSATTSFDSSTNSYSLTSCPNTTGPTGGTTGKFGRAGTFDGSDDYVDNTTLSWPSSGTAVTVSYWSYVATSDIQETSSFNVGGAVTTNNRFQAHAPWSDQVVYWDYGDSSGNGRISASYTNYYDKWTYVTLVSDGNGGSFKAIYFDGVLAASSTTSDGPDIALTGVRLAAWQSYRFKGKLDDFKIYNYRRTPAQITEDMNASHPLGGSPIASQILYWNFDEGTGTTANNIGTAGSGSNGTLTSMASPATTSSGWTRTGKLNSGLLFDGSNDNVVLATASDAAVDFNGSESFSGSAWVYITTMPGTNEMDAIITKWDATTPTRGYRLVVTNDDSDTTGNFRVEMYDESTDQTISAFGANDSVSVNTWYHVAFSFTGGIAGAAGDLVLYTDGKLTAQNAANTSFLGLEDVSADFTVGDYDTTDAAAADTAFTGTIDEVKIYPGVLPSSQVMVDRNYNSAASISNGSDERSTFTDGIGTDPLIYWNFDENTGTSSVSNKGNGSTTVNTGTLNAITSSDWVPGKIGSALHFNGTSQYVSLADTADLSPTTISTNVWIKPEKLASTVGDSIVVYEHENTTNPFEAYSLYMDSGDDRMYCKFCNSSNTCALPSTINSLSANTWYHLTCTWDGSTVKTYLNGDLQSSAALTGSIKNGDDAFTLGAGDAGFSFFFPGIIDDFKLYGYARTQAQIQQDYNRGKPLAWWKFDECQGTTLNDATGNGFTGTWNGTGGGSQTAAGTCSTSSTAWGNGAVGKWNTDLNFDGTDDYVQVADTHALRFDTNTLDFSLFAWVKRAANGEMNIISKEDADNDGWRLQFTSTNTVRCSVNAIDIDSTSTITDTNWHFVGCTISRAGNGQVYIDGVANGSATAISSTTMATTSNIRIGTRSYTSTNYFNGQIDDLRIYYYALSPAQIRLLLNNDSPARFGPLTGTPLP